MAYNMYHTQLPKAWTQRVEKERALQDNFWIRQAMKGQQQIIESGVLEDRASAAAAAEIAGTSAPQHQQKQQGFNTVGTLQDRNNSRSQNNSVVSSSRKPAEPTNKAHHVFSAQVGGSVVSRRSCQSNVSMSSHATAATHSALKQQQGSGASACGSTCTATTSVLSGRLAQLEAAVVAERARREALEADLAAIKMQQQ